MITSISEFSLEYSILILQYNDPNGIVSRDVIISGTSHTKEIFLQRKMTFEEIFHKSYKSFEIFSNLYFEIKIELP